MATPPPRDDARDWNDPPPRSDDAAWRAYMGRKAEARMRMMLTYDNGMGEFLEPNYVPGAPGESQAAGVAAAVGQIDVSSSLPQVPPNIEQPPLLDPMAGFDYENTLESVRQEELPELPQAPEKPLKLDPKPVEVERIAELVQAIAKPPEPAGMNVPVAPPPAAEPPIGVKPPKVVAPEPAAPVPIAVPPVAPPVAAPEATKEVEAPGVIPPMVGSGIRVNEGDDVDELRKRYEEQQRRRMAAASQQPEGAPKPASHQRGGLGAQPMEKPMGDHGKYEPSSFTANPMSSGVDLVGDGLAALEESLTNAEGTQEAMIKLLQRLVSTAVKNRGEVERLTDRLDSEDLSDEF